MTKSFGQILSLYFLIETTPGRSFADECLCLRANVHIDDTKCIEEHLHWA